MSFFLCEEVELYSGPRLSAGSYGSCRTELKLAYIGTPVDERGCVECRSKETQISVGGACGLGGKQGAGSETGWVDADTGAVKQAQQAYQDRHGRIRCRARAL